MKERPDFKKLPEANIIVAYDWDQDNGSKIGQMTPLFAEKGREVAKAQEFLISEGKERRSNPRLFVKVPLS